MSDQLDQFLNEQLAKNKAVDRAIDRINSFETRGTFFGACGSGSIVNAANNTLYNVPITAESYDFAPADWLGGMINTNLALTGTMSVALGSTTVTGVGTLFLTELWRGAVIIVNGLFSGTIKSVQSNTVATMYFTSLNNAGAGSAGIRTNLAMGIPSSGLWELGIYAVYAQPATPGFVQTTFNLPGLISLPGVYARNINGGTYAMWSCPYQLSEGRIYNPQVLQLNTGGAASNITIPLVWAHKLS